MPRSVSCAASPTGALVSCARLVRRSWLRRRRPKCRRGFRGARQSSRLADCAAAFVSFGTHLLDVARAENWVQPPAPATPRIWRRFRVLMVMKAPRSASLVRILHSIAWTVIVVPMKSYRWLLLLGAALCAPAALAHDHWRRRFRGGHRSLLHQREQELGSIMAISETRSAVAVTAMLLSGLPAHAAAARNSQPIRPDTPPW